MGTREDVTTPTSNLSPPPLDRESREEVGHTVPGKRSRPGAFSDGDGAGGGGGGKGAAVEESETERILLAGERPHRRRRHDDDVAQQEQEERQPDDDEAEIDMDDARRSAVHRAYHESAFVLRIPKSAVVWRQLWNTSVELQHVYLGSKGIKALAGALRCPAARCAYLGLMGTGMDTVAVVELLDAFRATRAGSHAVEPGR